MIRRALLFPSLLALVLAPALKAQVGHLPEESPYQDLLGRQSLTFGLGVISPGQDPAGVAPRSGAVLTARYELLLSGPLWLRTRMSYAPALDRTVKDPLLTGAARDAGTSTRPLTMAEVGFAMNLTGAKSWNRLVPRAHGALGWASGGSGRFDVGGYKFGNKFMLSYGTGARIVTGSKYEIDADLTHAFWKYSYPDAYGGDGSASDPSILGREPLSAWQGNFQFTVGVSRFFFR